MHKLIEIFRKEGEKGAVNLGGIIIMGLSMVFLAVGFIFLPITSSASSSLLSYVYSGNATITAAHFTGYTAVVGITPLLILIGYLAAAVITGMLGIKIIKGEGGEGHADPGSLMLMGISIVFIAIGLIIEPIALDGVSTALSNGGSGISASFTGYEAILKVAPMLIHFAFLAGAVITGFFGIKRLGVENPAG